jgi:hypothetical protein
VVSNLRFLAGDGEGLTKAQKMEITELLGAYLSANISP